MISKKINGGVYYYLAESARVEGKPRIVSQRYLGTAAEIAAVMDGACALPHRTRHLAFGDLAAVWGVLERLRVVETIDEVVGPRRSDAGASVGTYIALATLNRVVKPCSKLAIADWWATTAGHRLVRITPAALDHRRFWDAMHKLDTDALREAERRICATLVAEFGLDLSVGLALDMTNFATYIDSTNTRAPIAQRGHAKQKRTDLRIVGLGLVVSRDGGVPLVSLAYPGNAPDVTQFRTVVDELVARYHTVAGPAGKLSVVFDAGQNSEDNFTHLRAQKLSYVGSLPPSDHPALLAIPHDRYQPVDPDRYPELSYVDTTVEALGASHRAVLTHSTKLHAGQGAGLDQQLAKATRSLDELAATLARGRTRRQRPAVEADIARTTKKRWVNRVLRTTLTGDTPATMALTWHLDLQARADLEQEIFGKRILITDHTDWPAAQVVAAYRSQSDAENSFRQLKDTKVVSFSPMHHWTDAHIRVHTFHCVLALTVVHLMRRETHRAGNPLSVRKILTTLAGIQETVLIYPSTGGRPKARSVLTDMTPTQTNLYQLFQCHRWAPTTT